MRWKCATCGIEHADMPLCFGIDAPWRALVPEDEFPQRVELNADQCVVDEKTFVIRGHIEIPIHGYSENLSFSVWSSLSEQSFLHICDRWEARDRANDPPYFGWLCSPISVYPSTIHLKLSVQSRPPSLTPIFNLFAADSRISHNEFAATSASIRVYSPLVGTQKILPVVHKILLNVYMYIRILYSHAHRCAPAVRSFTIRYLKQIDNSCRVSLSPPQPGVLSAPTGIPEKRGKTLTARPDART
jgi:hypothetical protein